MRFASFAMTVLAVAVLSACGQPQDASSPLPAAPGTGSQSSFRSLPDSFGSDVASGIKELAVSQYAENDAVLLNATYKQIGTISNGLSGPEGDWVDAKGNLYVADYNGGVQEYKKGATSPTFTYSSGLANAVGVTTDSKGNVYVTDFNSGNPGYIDEYPQGKNTLANQCSVSAAPEGVAVDSKGHVFVSYGTSVSLFNGLPGCNATLLGATITAARGMILDSKGDLIACDGLAGKVYVFAPPYNTVKTTFSGLASPFAVAINAKNKLLFVAEYGADVAVIEYPSGKPVTKLGSGNGLSGVTGVAVYPPEKK